jgi:hypothetical protein
MTGVFHVFCTESSPQFSFLLLGLPLLLCSSSSCENPHAPKHSNIISLRSHSIMSDIKATKALNYFFSSHPDPFKTLSVTKVHALKKEKHVGVLEHTSVSQHESNHVQTAFDDVSAFFRSPSHQTLSLDMHVLAIQLSNTQLYQLSQEHQDLMQHVFTEWAYPSWLLQHLNRSDGFFRIPPSSSCKTHI